MSIALPTPADILPELVAFREEIQSWPEPEDPKRDVRIHAGAAHEVRLQACTDGCWAVWTGDPCYDTDHHGFWASSRLDGTETDPELVAIAKALIGEVSYQMEECEAE